MLQQTTVPETRVHYKRYVHHAHAAGVTWALLTCCFLIINVIVFAEPQWIGDTDSSPGTGWAGLYHLCELINSGTVEVCSGYFQDFTSILSDAFRASTFFIGVSCLLVCLCVLLFLLFLFCQQIYVYIICGVLQVLSTIFMFLGCVIYPRGWDNIMVQRICGDTMSPYHLGQCQMRWAYILAIIGVFDILILAILAFVLAFRQADRWTKYDQMLNGKAKPNPNAGYVVDVSSSKPGSVIVPHQQALPRSAPGGGHYPPSQLVYIVDDGPRGAGGAGGAGSEFGAIRRVRGTPHGSEAHLESTGGSVYRGRGGDDRGGSF